MRFLPCPQIRRRKTPRRYSGKIARRRSNMNHSQKTEVLTNEDAAIERLCVETVALVKHARNITVQQVNMIQL